MIKKLLHKPIASLVFLLFLTQGLFAQFPGSPVTYQRQEVSDQKVQLALLLDASGSMKDYMEQAKGELWYTVNEILSAYEGYATPRLEIAIMVYGFRQAGKRNNFIYTVVPFTTDLDWAASELYKIETGGRVERPIRAINDAVTELNWSFKSGDLKFLFIAGNEKFAQGNWELNQMKQAKAADISINTIFAGSYIKGIQKVWKAAAAYGNGAYFALEQPNQDRWQHQPSYNRDYISRLNRSLYDTYLPYGSSGGGYWDRYCYLDNYAWEYGSEAYYWRVYYKTQVNYYNPQWDLVDAIVCGYTSWDDIEDDDLPQDIRGLNLDDRQAYVDKLWNRRQLILKDIRAYGSTKGTEGSFSGPSGGSGSSGGNTVGSFQEAINRTVRKKVQSSDAVLLKPADIYTPPIPNIGEPGKDREVGRRKAAPQSSGAINANPQTTILRQERPAIEAAPISTDKRVFNTVDKPKSQTPPRQITPVKSRDYEIKKATIGSVSQQKQEDQKIQSVQIEADKAREVEIQKIERVRQDKIAAEHMEREKLKRLEKDRQSRINVDRAATQALQDKIIREQKESERIAKERKARIASQQAAEREQQQQITQERANKELVQRERAERERQNRIAAQQAADRERQQQMVQEREEIDIAQRDRAARERQARISEERAQERERQQQVTQERDERERTQRIERAQSERADRQRQERAQAQREADRQRQQQQVRAKAQRERQAQTAAAKSRQERSTKQAKETVKRQQIQKKAATVKPSPSKSIQRSSGKMQRKN